MFGKMLLCLNCSYPVLLSFPDVTDTTPLFGFIFDISPLQSSNSNWYTHWVEVTEPLIVVPALSYGVSVEPNG